MSFHSRLAGHPSLYPPFISQDIQTNRGRFKRDHDATRKLIELINEFDKVAGYKIHAQKSLAFLYTNDEKSEREIEETLPFTTATKRIKYLGINLPTETKDLYAENYRH